MYTIDDISKFIFLSHPLEKADMIFVPGNSRPEMMERAAWLYSQGYAAYILPSGRYSILNGKFMGVKSKVHIYTGDYKTESEFLTDVGIKNDVPKESILKEDQATYTMENAVYSKKLLESLNIEVKTGIICCSSIHSRRAYMYYQMAFPNTKFIMDTVDIDSIGISTWNTTKEGKEAVRGEFSRIATQFNDLVP